MTNIYKSPRSSIVLAAPDEGRFMPVALLLFVQFIERLIYFGWRTLFVLFLIDQTSGPALSKEEALALYGMATIGIYFCSLFGGLLSDFILGALKTSISGFVVTFIGFLWLTVFPEHSYTLGTVLIVLGVGLIKPNILVTLGYCCGEKYLDGIFTFYYMIINVAALLAGLLFSIFLNKNFQWAFIALSVMSLLCSLILFSAQNLFSINSRMANRKVEKNYSMSYSMLWLFTLFIILFCFWSLSHIDTLLFMENKIYQNVSMITNVIAVFVFSLVLGLLWIFKSLASPYKVVLSLILLVALQIVMQVIEIDSTLGILIYVMAMSLVEIVLLPVIYSLAMQKIAPPILATSMALLMSAGAITNFTTQEFEWTQKVFYLSLMVIGGLMIWLANRATITSGR